MNIEVILSMLFSDNLMRNKCYKKYACVIVYHKRKMFYCLQKFICALYSLHECDDAGLEPVAGEPGSQAPLEGCFYLDSEDKTRRSCTHSLVKREWLKYVTYLCESVHTSYYICYLSNVHTKRYRHCFGLFQSLETVLITF